MINGLILQTLCVNFMQVSVWILGEEAFFGLVGSTKTMSDLSQLCSNSVNLPSSCSVDCNYIYEIVVFITSVKIVHHIFFHLGPPGSELQASKMLRYFKFSKYIYYIHILIFLPNKHYPLN